MARGYIDVISIKRRASFDERRAAIRQSCAVDVSVKVTLNLICPLETSVEEFKLNDGGTQVGWTARVLLWPTGCAPLWSLIILHQ